MSYNEALAESVRTALKGKRGFSEKKMFGGLSFLLNGNMCCGIIRNNLVVRVGPEQYEKALKRRHARPMDFTGKPLTGYVYVGPSGCSTRAELKRWIELGIAYTRGLKRKPNASAGG